MEYNEELSRYMILIEQYKEQLNNLDMQSQYLQAAIMDYNKAKIALEELDKTDKGAEALLPIGGGVYIDASVINPSNVLIDIGGGIVAERKIEDAIKKIDKRIINLQKTQEKLAETIQNIQAEAVQISEKAQKLMVEEQNK